MKKNLGKEGEIINDDSTINLGLIGCGSHAFRNILPSLRFIDEANLVATCDINSEKAKMYSDKYGAKNYFTDFKKMLDLNLDGVIVITSFDLETGKPTYPEITAKILESNTNVFIEKPPASSRIHYEIIEEAEKNSDAFVQIGFKMMFAPAIEKVKKLIQRSDFGKVQSYEISYAVDLPSDIRNLMKPESRRFLDDIVHPISQIVSLFDMPESMEYFTSGESDGFALLDHGLYKGVLHMTSGVKKIGPLETLKIVGEGPMIELKSGEEIRYYNNRDVESYSRGTNFVGKKNHIDLYTPSTRRPLGALSLHSHALYGYINELNYFVNCIKNRKKPKKSGLNHGKKVMKIYDMFSFPPNEKHSLNEEVRVKSNNNYSQKKLNCPNCNEKEMKLKDGWNFTCKKCGITKQSSEVFNCD